MRRGDTMHPVMTGETHRTTSFEIFFDLVFVFAITRVVSFMAHSPMLITAPGTEPMVSPLVTCRRSPRSAS